MAEPTVRLLASDELTGATRLVGRQMLAPLTDEVANGWAEVWEGNPSHGAFADKELVGVCHWFPTRLAIPGLPVDAGAVTGVAVLSNHRRQGHLSRLMQAQLRHIADAGAPVAVLIAAEYPIYGRFGYGPATEACTLTLDTKAARFRDEQTGSIVLVDPPELRPALQQAHEARWTRTPGAMLRTDFWWDRMAGVAPRPGEPLDVKLQRGALWYDGTGQLGGAVVYKVEERWTDNRPDGVANVELLFGATPEAERELWRHLCTVDWCATAKAGGRALDDPLPFWLQDARMARSSDRSDNMWLRLLDLPAAFAARRSAIAGSAVLEVDDPLGFVAGRWLVELGPDGGSARPT
ncbi:MAG TPA: GNAT family N-acetyltransferase, partial [Acidimicrobiales bacterium]|nr:GNAT family N-acetyltransferase [Acidimicrobiales bacterium]